MRAGLACLLASFATLSVAVESTVHGSPAPCANGAERLTNGTVLCLPGRAEGARPRGGRAAGRGHSGRGRGGGRGRGAKGGDSGGGALNRVVGALSRLTGGGAKGRGAAPAKAPRKPRDNKKDVGCHPGDKNNMALPWSQQEGLAPHNVPWSGTLAPYLRSRPRKCAIVVDRHVHKNGGSTVRDLFLEHERMGLALYQGYTQMYWQRDAKALRERAARTFAANRTLEGLLLIEAHFGWVELSQEVLPGLKRLAQMYAEGGADCPLVLMTRVREPLDYYLSFYRWGVAYRQKADPDSFGEDFLSWVKRVPNLQSTTMMQSMAAMAAEYHLGQYPQYVRSPMVGKTEELAWQKLTAFLDAFTIVATMKRFDESLLMAADLVGLPLMLYKRNKPNQKGGFRGTSATVCPDMELCRKAVREAAGRDHKMYERYSTRFEAKVAALGPAFGKRVAQYKAAVADAQAMWRRAPRKQFICRYHPETTERVAVLRKSNIRCPIEGATDLCQSVYAHRLFECPWQFRPNSSLSDPLGCWRPSSGFNR